MQELFKVKNRNQLNQHQKNIKRYLKGRWFWKSLFKIDRTENYDKSYLKTLEHKGTYIRDIADAKTSFTKKLRNDKGYDQYLKLKYS